MAIRFDFRGLAELADCVCLRSRYESDEAELILIVGVNESTTVSSAWELTSLSMHYSQGNGVHTPLSRLVLYPRAVCLSVLVIVCVWSTHGTAMCCRGRE